MTSPPTPVPPSINKLLIAYRSAHDLTLKEMAKNLEIALRTYADLEDGAHPSFYTFRNIVLFFGLTADQVMHYVLTSNAKVTGPPRAARRRTKARAITGTITQLAG